MILYEYKPDDFHISAEKFGKITSKGINLLSYLFSDIGYRILRYYGKPTIDENKVLKIYDMMFVFRSKIVYLETDYGVVLEYTIPDDGTYYVGFNNADATNNDTYISLVISDDPNDIEYYFMTISNYTITFLDTEWADILRNIDNIYKFMTVKSQYTYGQTGIIVGGRNYKDIVRFNMSTGSIDSSISSLSVNYYNGASTSNSVNNDLLLIGGIIGLVQTNKISKLNIVNTESQLEVFSYMKYSDSELAATSNGDLNRAVYLHSSNMKDLSTNKFPSLNTIAMYSLDFKIEHPVSEHGYLDSAKIGMSAESNQVNNDGVYAGGFSDKYLTTSDIYGFRIDIKSNAAFFGYLTTAVKTSASASNGILNEAVFCGGLQAININDSLTYVQINDINKIKISIYQHASLLKELTYGFNTKATSNAEGNKAFLVSGSFNSVSTNKIQQFTISTGEDFVNDFAELTNIYDNSEFVSSNG